MLQHKSQDSIKLDKNYQIKLNVGFKLQNVSNLRNHKRKTLNVYPVQSKL